MAEPAWTPGPWRHKTIGSMGGLIEGPTSRRYYDGDDGYRPVASYQEACDSPYVNEQNANREANGNLIMAAPELYEALSKLAREVATVCGIAENAIRESAGNTNLSALWERQATATLALAKARGER